MSKFYFIVKGASKGDNVGTWQSKNELTALKELEEQYNASDHRLTIRIIDKSDHDKLKKEFEKIRLEKALES